MENNQLPSSYHSDYFLSSCAGARQFEFGVETDHSIFKYLFTIAKNVKGKRVLDVGCGRGEVVLSALRRGASRSMGLDFSQEAIDIAQKNLECSHDINPDIAKLVCVDALSCNLGEKFDVIFIADVVEHMYDPQIMSLLKNMSAHLMPDGIIVIHTMPTREFIIIGQYFKKFFYILRRKPCKIITFEEQAKETHVNLQSKSTLKKLLSPYKYRLWNDFSEDSFFRKVLRSLGLTRILSSNLWAVVRN